ncbi:MAG TPA: sigma-70 family RNA polymerase sigma factor [Polyangia bacterium]|jgi:RNA polymerase sigma-70 factor (ECF subfamily)|nr:sigma-70 family RNA polymerase sigma factor [Polyangia bacterium]
MVRRSNTHLTLLPPAQPAETVDNTVGPLTLAWAYRQYAPYVARIGTRILGCNDHEIDDLVQDVFAEAVAGLRRLAHPAEVRGWLATVTVRVATRRIRVRRLRRFFFLGSDRLASEPVCPAANPEQRALIRHVYRYLDQMPARQRTAWVLRYIEEERLDDVARYCECSLATAKRLISAAEAWIERNIHDAAD